MSKRKHMQVRKYYNRCVAPEHRTAFLEEMAKWDNTTEFAVFCSFYDIEVLDAAHDAAKER